jgi:two-component system sensor histidine kinase VicK
MPAAPTVLNDQIFLTGGGEMGELVRSLDWGETSLGHPASWPASLKNFTSLLLSSPSPMLICWGEDHIQLYNDAFRPILGANKHPEALGISAVHTYAEIWSTVGPLFNRVLNGETVSNPELLVKIDRNGYTEDCYFNYSYNPVKDEHGHVGGILVICIETTEQVKNLRKLEKATAETLAANKELDETQHNLHNLLNILTESDFKFRTLIKEAPVAIALLNGRELLIEAANDLILKMWGKHPAIIGSRLIDAMPELIGQPFFDLIAAVFETGEPYYGSEGKAMMEHEGTLKEGFYNFIYQPIKDETGRTTRVMVVATDVTEQITARKGLEEAYERERLAKEAAQLGTFDMNMQTGALEWDDRCRHLFGITHHDKITYEEDFVSGLHPEDRERIEKEIANVMVKAIDHGNYDVEYRTVGAEDKKVRWVRAKGKVYFDEKDKPLRFLGSVLDITEQKQDELRKNDFIGMVSHELKTPLTTLKAYIQVMSVKTKTSDDAFFATALRKANMKVKAMENMISGFLNISRLESGKLSISKQNFNLDELLQDEIDELELASESHKFVFNACTPQNIFADKDKIGSVITNLLSNAVKYSPKGTVITVDCNIAEADIQVSIKDEGMGIQPRDMPNLFSRYYRVESKNTMHISGFGIGLYLSSEIIKQHGGNIWAESWPNTGSTFFFRIPIGSAASARN